MSDTSKIEDLLESSDPAKNWFRQRVLGVLSDESTLPGFSPTSMWFLRRSGELEIPLQELTDAIALDPSLSLQCLKVVNSAAYGRGNIKSIEEAVLMLGQKETTRIAMSMSLMGDLNHLRIKVDWHRFWLHSLLVARLTNQLASCFKEHDGTGYLAGLLHDMGKLVLEHFFPREFEDVIMRANGRQRSHWQTETELLGLNHAQIGAAMCRTLGAHPQVVMAIRHHHQPMSGASVNAPFTHRGFLACCLAVSNALANLADTSFECNEILPDLEDLPEWHYLGEFDPIESIDLDLATAREEAEADVEAMSLGPQPQPKKEAPPEKLEAVH